MTAQKKTYPQADGVPVMCGFTEIVHTDSLTENPANPNTHPERQLQILADTIKKTGWRMPITVSTRSGYIVKGHGRYKAAKLAGLKQVPVERQDYASKEKEMADLIADNKIASMAIIDEETLERELFKIADTQADAPTGFSPEDIEEMTNGGTSSEETSHDETASREQQPEETGGDETGSAGWESGYNERQANGSLLKDFGVPPFTVLDSSQTYWQERSTEWANLIDAEEIAQNTVDPVLAEIIVRWFTPAAGAKCFDVFAGDSIFGHVCSALGMQHTGGERHDEIEPESQDLIFCNPPKYDGAGAYKDFFAAQEAAITTAIALLKNNRFAAIVVDDIRSHNDGSILGYMEHIKQTFRGNGMCLYNDLIFLTHDNAGANEPTRKVGRSHKNILIFFKGDTNTITQIFPRIETTEETTEDASEDE